MRQLICWLKRGCKVFVLEATNRDFVDKRLNDLKQQKHKLEARLEELDRLYLSQAEINNIITDAIQFLSGLEYTLRQGLPHTKLVALRQCIERVLINKPAGILKLSIRLVPTGNLQATQEVEASI